MVRIDYGRMAEKYSQYRKIHPDVLRSLVTNGRVESASKVLEVGCGTGNYIIALEEIAGCSCWGIDPSELMLAKAGEQSDSITFQSGKAEELRFPGYFFDLIFSVDAIHHLEYSVRYFHEAHRATKPNGKVCTVTDSEWIIRHRQPLATYFPETVEVDLRRYPPITRLREVMKQAGFGEITEENVEFSYELRNIQAYRDKAFSCLHLIPEEAFQKGIKRMKRELTAGPICCVSRYLLLWGTRTALAQDIGPKLRT